MTTQAWIMLMVTWSVTLGFTARFLYMAVTRPDDDEDDA